MRKGNAQAREELRGAVEVMELAVAREMVCAPDRQSGEEGREKCEPRAGAQCPVGNALKRTLCHKTRLIDPRCRSPGCLGNGNGNRPLSTPAERNVSFWR